MIVDAVNKELDKHHGKAREMVKYTIFDVVSLQ